MGFYIDNTIGGPERWLRDNAVACDGVPCYDVAAEDGFVIVCLLDAGVYKCAGIVYSPDELKRFDNPDDERPRKWYLVERAKIKAVSPHVRIKGIDPDAEYEYWMC